MENVQYVKFRPLVSIFDNFNFCIVVEGTSEEKSVNFLKLFEIESRASMQVRFGIKKKVIFWV